MQPHVRRFVERAVTFQTCPDCEGTRLTPEARSSKIGGKSIADVAAILGSLDIVFGEIDR